MKKSFEYHVKNCNIFDSHNELLGVFTGDVVAHSDRDYLSLCGTFTASRDSLFPSMDSLFLKSETLQ